MGESNRVEEHYRCVRKLSGDDREVLWEARVTRPDGVEQPCLLRIIARDASDDELMRKRFTQQALIAYDTSVNHRHLLTLRRFGTWHDGRLFMAMDLVRGRTVAELRDELVGDIPRIHRIAAGVLRALTYLHGQRIACGAVQPPYISVGDDDTVRLTDYRSLQQNALDSQLVEDLRALGAILFDLAVGAPPQRDPESWKPALDGAEVTPEVAAVIAGLLSGRLTAAEALVMLGGATGGRGPKKGGNLRDAFDEAIDDDAVESVYAAFADNLAYFVEAVVERSREAAIAVFRPLMRPLHWLLGIFIAAAAAVALLAYQQWRERAEPAPSAADAPLSIAVNFDEDKPLLCIPAQPPGPADTAAPEAVIEATPEAMIETTPEAVIETTPEVVAADSAEPAPARASRAVYRAKRPDARADAPRDSAA
jgi:hypothetical protein